MLVPPNLTYPIFKAKENQLQMKLNTTFGWVPNEQDNCKKWPRFFNLPYCILIPNAFSVIPD